MPNGEPGFMVANYANGKRRFDSYSTEADALDAANRLARQLSTRDTKAATLTENQAVEYVRSAEVLQPFGVTVGAASEAVAQWLEKLGDMSVVHDAVKMYNQRHKRVIPKRVADVVADLLAVKEARGASVRYHQDLRNRLNRFVTDFQKDIGGIATADLQAWFDKQKFGSQNYMGFRRTIHLLFEFALARGHVADNPVAALERIKVKHGATQVFTPKEIAALLKAASPDFLPCIAIGAFSGLRSAEIERLEWSDVDLAQRHIIVGADRAKTASRRIAPMPDNLALWLASYAGHKGKVWTGEHDEFYDAQQDTAKAAGLKWKANALRHSAASYMFALSNDAGRVAGFLGNSAAVVHRHYRELVRPSDAKLWFNVTPQAPANVVSMGAVANQH
jgi:integrase